MNLKKAEKGTYNSSRNWSGTECVKDFGPRSVSCTGTFLTNEDTLLTVTHLVIGWRWRIVQISFSLFLHSLFSIFLSFFLIFIYMSASTAAFSSSLSTLLSDRPRDSYWRSKSPDQNFSNSFISLIFAKHFVDTASCLHCISSATKFIFENNENFLLIHGLQNLICKKHFDK